MSDYQHMFYLTRTVAVNAVIFYHPKIRHTVKNLYCGVVNGFTLKLPVDLFQPKTDLFSTRALI